MTNNYWYAVMMDRDDNDWGTGSYDLEKAKEMLLRDYPDGYIAVIENDVCIDEITPDQF